MGFFRDRGQNPRGRVLARAWPHRIRRVKSISAILVLTLMAVILVAVGSSDSAHAAGKCGELISNYKVKIKKGDIGCTNARRVMRQFSNNIANGQCDQPPECSDASPSGWNCKNLRDKPGEYPGPVLKCQRDGTTVLLVYTGPPITGE